MSVQCPLHTLGKLVAAGFGGDVVGGAGLFIVVGDDAAQKLGGVAATAAARHVYSRRGFGVFVIALAGDPLVHIRLVGFAAARHRDVQQGTAGGVAEHGVGGVGGDALRRVHGDRVAVGDVLTQVVPGEGGAGAVIEPAGGDPRVLCGGIDGVDLPAVAVAHRNQRPG